MVAVRPLLVDVPLAHPLTQPFNFPVSPLVAASVGAVAVILVALAWPQAHDPPADEPTHDISSWTGTLSTFESVTRLFAVAVLALAISAGRLGLDDELENLAPALVVGAAWPLLVLASALLGPVWRWTDPWDGVGRLLLRGQESDRPDHVWPAAFLAVPWVWYLSAYPDTLAPRSVGAFLALYTLLSLCGCVAFGRERWLGSCEPLGIVLSWMARLPRGRLGSWNPPPGAEALLGVLAGGVLFGAARRSELWGSLNTVDRALLVATVGVVVSCAAAAGLLVWMRKLIVRPVDRSVIAQMAVPAVAAIIVAVAMDRNRVFTSVQLLPGLFGDPFGRGWDLFGRAGAGLDPAPLGTRGLLAGQLAVLLAGHLAAALVLARRVRRPERAPGAAALAILAAAAVIAIASH